ncbi:hypothetical protein ACLOJK_015863 [Asimina triloba]
MEEGSEELVKNISKPKERLLKGVADSQGTEAEGVVAGGKIEGLEVGVEVVVMEHQERGGEEVGRRGVEATTPPAISETRISISTVVIQNPGRSSLNRTPENPSMCSPSWREVGVGKMVGLTNGVHGRKFFSRSMQIKIRANDPKGNGTSECGSGSITRRMTEYVQKLRVCFQELEESYLFNRVHQEALDAGQ